MRLVDLDLYAAWALTGVLFVMVIAGLAVAVSAPFRSGTMKTRRQEAVGGIIMAFGSLFGMALVAAMIQSVRP